MTFEKILPARTRTAIEITGEVDEFFESSREKFLEINPDCNYKVVKGLTDVEGTFEIILVQSPFFGSLSHKKLNELIEKLTEHLEEQGVLIFILENVGSSKNISALLEGKPPQTKVTLTLKELNDAVNASNLNFLRSLKITSTFREKPRFAEYAKTELNVEQYVIEAYKGSLPEKTMIQTFIGESTVCAPSRVHMPNDFLSAEPNVFISTMKAGDDLNLFSKEQFNARVFINQRSSLRTFSVCYNIFRQLSEKGILFVAEMDDNPIIWKDSYQKTEWAGFRAAHAIQTSTQYLADFLGQFNPHVKIFMNHLRRLPPPRDFENEFRRKRPVTIFFGAVNRDSDFLEIVPLLNRIIRQHGDKIAFKILARLNLFEALETKNKVYVGDLGKFAGQFVSYKMYEEAIRDSDISLLPLQDNEFNRSKSDLKFIECAANGTVVLASPVVYGNIIKDGINGFIYHNEREFINKLNMLIKNRNLRRQVAETAYSYVRHERLMSQHYLERLDWYRELLAKLPELISESQARMEKFIPKFQNEMLRYRE